ncbi:FAD binding domain-containing protein [Stutzerimonas azotifigens]|uniref:FAD binding domain-containing protein n=1 Tax=Stutzerimonas azotifigens TaxID=291995 RepID=UPI000412D3C2|nr:FAD binding domain-containing protein [Stutzerimonas azotifigens]
MAARPSSTDQAVLRGEAIYLAGGTAVQLAWDQAGPPAPLVDALALLPPPSVEPLEAGGLRLAASCTLEQLRTHPLVQARAPLLAEACRTLASYAVRQLATLGGNLAWGFGDCLAVLLAQGATAHLDDGRRLPLAEYLALTPRPLLLAVTLDGRPAAFARYEKVGLRAAFSPSRVALCLLAERDGGGQLVSVRAAAVGAGLPGRRLAHTEAWLEGRDPMTLTLGDRQLRAAAEADFPDAVDRARVVARLLAGWLSEEEPAP